MRKNRTKKLAGGLLLVLGAAAIAAAGCSPREAVSESAETVTETSSGETSAAATEAQTESASDEKGQPALRDAMVMVSGTLYIWSYDLELSGPPEDYSLAGTVETVSESGKPAEDLEALGLDVGDEIYVRSEGESGTIFVSRDGEWSAFIPYDDVASAYEYSKEPWTYDASEKAGGFRITLPDGSWIQDAGGDWSIYNFSGNGGTVSVIHLDQEEAEEIYPYIDTEAECRELILNTGASGEFELLNFEAGLADSDTDPDACYYHFQVSYPGGDSDYGYEERYALYCEGGFWEVQILMKSGEETARETAAGILDSFTVPTCES